MYPYHLFVKLKQLPIFFTPRIGSSIVRICKPTQAHFVSIVNRRSSYPCHLNCHRFSHNRTVDSFLRSLRSHMFGAADNMIRTGQESGMIMIGQLVHCHLQRRCKHACHKVTHRTYKIIRISPQICPAFIAVFLHSGKEPCQRLHKRVIVHDTVPLVTLEPFNRISVMLCQDQCIRIRLFYLFSETFPKHVVIFIAAPQICSYIQPPPVYIIGRRYPFPSDVHYILLKFRRVLIGQFRKRIMPPPSVVTLIIWPCLITIVMEMEKFPVRAVRAYISPFWIFRLRLINPLPIQPFIERPAMIKYTVQDDTHPTPVHLLHQSGKQFVAGFQIADITYSFLIFGCMYIVRCAFRQCLAAISHDFSIVRIDIVVILNIIFMIGWGYKQRIKVNHFNPQILKIVQLIQNPLKISSVEITNVQGFRHLIPVFYLPARRANINIFSILHIIVRIPIAEAIHKNLVHDRAFGPLRCLKSRNDHICIIIFSAV